MDSQVTIKHNVTETEANSTDFFHQETYSVILAASLTTVGILNFAVSCFLVFTILNSRRLRFQHQYLYILHYSVLMGINEFLVVVYVVLYLAKAAISWTHICVALQIHALLHGVTFLLLILMTVDWLLATDCPSKSTVFRRKTKLGIGVIYSLMASVLLVSIIMCTAIHVELFGPFFTLALLSMLILVVIFANKRHSFATNLTAIGLMVPTVIKTIWVIMLLSFAAVEDRTVTSSTLVIFYIFVLCSPCYTLLISWCSDEYFRQRFLKMKPDSDTDTLHVDDDNVDESNVIYGQLTEEQ